MAKGKIARFEQFLLLSLCFQKVVCRGVRKRQKLSATGKRVMLMLSRQRQLTIFYSTDKFQKQISMI